MVADTRTVPAQPPSGLGRCEGPPWLAVEPQAPLMLRLAGCSEVVASGLPCLELRGLDGSTVTVNPGAAPCLVASTPLEPPQPQYRGPLTARLDVELLAGGLASDFLGVWEGSVYRCFYGVGCRREAGWERLSRLETGCFRPLLVFPCAYARCARRVLRQLTVEAPWVCVVCGARAHILVCEGAICRLSVDPRGRVECEGCAFHATRAPRCSYPLLSTLLLSRAYGVPPRAARSPVRVLGAVPLALEGGVEGRLHVVRAWLWNPYPVAVTATASVERARVVEALAYYPSTSSWERLEPLANTVRVAIARYGLAYVEVRARRTLA